MARAEASSGGRRLVARAEASSGRRQPVARAEASSGGRTRAEADAGPLHLLVLLAVDVVFGAVVGELRSRLALASAALRSALIPARGRRGDEAGSGEGTKQGPARGK